METRLSDESCAKALRHRKLHVKNCQVVYYLWVEFRSLNAESRCTLASASIPASGAQTDKRSARIAVVEQHVGFENAHDLDGVLGTFGDTAHYDDEAWGEHYQGAGGVRQFYEELMKALPDLKIEIRNRHVTDDSVVLEVMIRGTHLGAWRGLPATGRRVDLPLCGVYTFDSDDRLSGEKIYYDRGTVLRQLGVFHEPQSILGQLCTVATHPITIARAMARKLRN
jgi:steroid delta-isomerase-like uncharacterized protein